MTRLLKLPSSPLTLILIFILGLLATAFGSFKNVKPLFITMIFYVSVVDGDRGLSSGTGVELAPNKFFPFSPFLCTALLLYYQSFKASVLCRWLKHHTYWALWGSSLGPLWGQGSLSLRSLRGSQRGTVLGEPIGKFRDKIRNRSVPWGGSTSVEGGPVTG